ncbi:MAG: hypothetical protein HYT12_00795 [Candidatus Liptonbacteria bacterium]|nr:hypothetical protein [Candidatus Liptonbacteria bacterium]
MLVVKQSGNAAIAALPDYRIAGLPSAAVLNLILASRACLYLGKVVR